MPNEDALGLIVRLTLPSGVEMAGVHDSSLRSAVAPDVSRPVPGADWCVFPNCLFLCIYFILFNPDLQVPASEKACTYA